MMSRRIILPFDARGEHARLTVAKIARGKGGGSAAVAAAAQQRRQQRGNGSGSAAAAAAARQQGSGGSSLAAARRRRLAWKLGGSAASLDKATAQRRR
jgi:hypothetical protein